MNPLPNPRRDEIAEHLRWIIQHNDSPVVSAPAREGTVAKARECLELLGVPEVAVAPAHADVSDSPSGS